MKHMYVIRQEFHIMLGFAILATAYLGEPRHWWLDIGLWKVRIQIRIR